MIFVAFEYEIGERDGAEGNVSWGKQVTISGAGNMRGIVRPVRIRGAPLGRSAVIYANLPVVTNERGGSAV